MKLLQASILIFISYFIGVALAATANDWRSRTIYQVVTDRFARSDSSTTPCSDLTSYCGGTFKGIINQLDYIQGMGFDAIWISPVPSNFGNNYHGYAANNLYEINLNFGTADDLKALVDELHKRNMYLMVDVVANHMGIPPNYDYRLVTPFNSTDHYHGCSSCPSSCLIEDWSNQSQIETCRLSGLPDLNQNNPYVNATLLSWIKQLVQNYSIDGLRLDTVREVNKSFWPGFQQAAGVYAVGEVFVTDDVDYVAQYQTVINGLLSYPLFDSLRQVFINQKSMYQLETINQLQAEYYYDQGLFGVFLDNHDNSRFLNSQSDQMLYKNGLVYVLMSIGIPIIYYGTEQGFHGANDPYCREPLWTTNYVTNTYLYAHLSTVVKARKLYQVWEYPQIQRYADDNFYAFTRGNTFVALTNVGSSGPQVHRVISFHPYTNGTKLCNVFWPSDCVQVYNSQFDVYLNNGEAKIFYPAS